MVEYQGLEFVGIVENIQDTLPFEYCCSNILSNGISMRRNLTDLGETIAWRYGENFRKKITYEPPEGIDMGGTKRGLNPRKYHKLSMWERHIFEESVLKALKGKKQILRFPS